MARVSSRRCALVTPQVKCTWSLPGYRTRHPKGMAPGKRCMKTMGKKHEKSMEHQRIGVFHGFLKVLCRFPTCFDGEHGCCKAMPNEFLGHLSMKLRQRCSDKVQSTGWWFSKNPLYEILRFFLIAFGIRRGDQVWINPNWFNSLEWNHQPGNYDQKLANFGLRRASSKIYPFCC